MHHMRCLLPAVSSAQILYPQSQNPLQSRDLHLGRVGQGHESQADVATSEPDPMAHRTRQACRGEKEMRLF